MRAHLRHPVLFFIGALFALLSVTADSASGTPTCLEQVEAVASAERKPLAGDFCADLTRRVAWDQREEVLVPATEAMPDARLITAVETYADMRDYVAGSSESVRTCVELLGTRHGLDLSRAYSRASALSKADGSLAAACQRWKPDEKATDALQPYAGFDQMNLTYTGKTAR